METPGAFTVAAHSSSRVSCGHAQRGPGAQGVGQGGRQGAYIHFGKKILEKATHFIRKCFPKKAVFANSLLFS